MHALLEKKEKQNNRFIAHEIVIVFSHRTISKLKTVFVRDSSFILPRWFEFNLLKRLDQCRFNTSQTHHSIFFNILDIQQRLFSRSSLTVRSPPL